MFSGLLVLVCAIQPGMEPAAPQALGRYYCPGGAGCARGDFMDVTIEGLGEVNAVLGGFTDSFYGSVTTGPLAASGVEPDTETTTSCSQPGYLTDRRFEFAGDVPGLGPVRLHLDPLRLSRGTVRPVSLPQSMEELSVETNIYPAVNDFRFFLRLDFPEFGNEGLFLVNENALWVRGQFNEWPPPLGTVYNLIEPVRFRERNPMTGEPTGPVLATLQMASHACFYAAEAGTISTTLVQSGLNGNQAVFQASVVSTVDTPAVWHAYTAGDVLTLNPTPPPVGAPEFGPQAGRVNLIAGVQQTVTFSGQFSQAGSQFVRFMIHADTGTGDSCMQRLSGSQNVVRAVLPNLGFSVQNGELQTYSLLAGTTPTVIFTGTDFQAPVSVAYSGPGISVTEIDVISAQELQVSLEIAPEAAPTMRDALLTSNGREFLMVQSNDVIWPPPMVSSVQPASLLTGIPTDVEITGGHFLPLSFVSMGPGVEVLDVTRLSPTMLRARVVPHHNATAVAAGALFDVIVLGANGAGGLDGAITLENCGNQLCDINLGEGCNLCSLDCSTDSDGDGDIDLQDVQRAINSMTGPNP